MGLASLCPRQDDLNKMKIRTKLAIVVLAAFMTLAGVNLIANAMVSAGVIASHGGHPSVTVQVTNVRVLV